MNGTSYLQRKVILGGLALLLLAATAGGVGAGDPQEAEKVRQAIEAYVKQDITLKGAFFLEDPGTGKVHQLDFALKTLDRLMAHAFQEGKGMAHVLDGGDRPRVWNLLASADPKSWTGPKAYVCSGAACALPTGDPKQVVALLRSFGR